MLIKLQQTSGDSPPVPDQLSDLLWEAEHGGEEAAEVEQIPGSVLTEIAEEFEVGRWYSLEEAKAMFSSAPSDSGVWTEVPVTTATSEGPRRVPMQVRKTSAAVAIIASVLDFAGQLCIAGRVWIRVE